MDVIQPRLPKGMRDILPRQMVLRQYVLNIVERTFAEFGFEPLITPSVELAEILLGKYGSEAEKLIFMVQHRGGKEQLALRYDLSVPLSRVVAQYPDLPKPFRRYQIAPVWRAERPQKGRYREFWQCDADIVGSSSMLADAEIIALIYTVLQRLGFQQFVIRINDRKILAGIGQYSGVPEAQLPELYRTIDKLDKIGMEAVRGELLGSGLAEQTVERLLALLQPEKDGQEALDDLSRELTKYPLAQEGIAELRELLSYLPSLGVREGFYRVDLAMVRGLDYYTGPIYETVVEKPRIGSITGGGRFDGLVGKFAAQSYPATGTTIGIERILDVMEELHMFPPDVGETTVQVLVTVFSAELMHESLRLITELRNAGLRCELYYDIDPLGNQIRYALKKGIPFVAILGPDELAAAQVTLRNLPLKSQVQVARSEVGEFLQRQFAAGVISSQS
ncbi:MAG: histidine--tRNA ligase [Anaerolineae bacterium]